MIKNSKPVRLVPDFLIIGAQKCGTTSLFQYMIQHPQILGANRKEIHFFDKKYVKGIEWYKRQFPQKPTGGKRFLIGEATPSYIYDQKVSGRIFNHMPGVRLIILLRNPVDRAYSQYHMQLRGKKHELFPNGINRDAVTFEEALDKNIGDYVTRGIYANQLERWLKLFPRHQLLILQSERFFADPEETLKKVYHFLGLPYHELEQYEQFRKGEYDEMNPKTREKLLAFFKPHNQRVYKLLKENFKWDS